MLGIIELIFSIVGIYGFFTENLICLVIGLISIIICDLIDIFVCGHNPITILLSCILATGISIVNKNPLYSFTITLCIENLAMAIITMSIIVISMSVGIIRSILRKEDSNVDYEEREKKSLLTNNKYWKSFSLILLIFVFAIGSILLYSEEKSKKEISNLHIKISNLKNEKEEISKKYFDESSKNELAKNKIDFMDNYVVIIPYNTKTYHKYECKHYNKNNGGSILHKEEAIEKGYKPCKYCIK